MAIGNFILVNGSILGGLLVASSDEGDAIWLPLVALAVGIAFIIAGYARFRHGEEVETLQDSAKKATLADGSSSKGMLSGGLELLGDLSGMDVKKLSDLGKL
jgi:hypothetical protein